MYKVLVLVKNDMHGGALLLRAYKMSLNLDRRGKSNWFTNFYVQTDFLMFGIIRVWDV